MKKILAICLLTMPMVSFAETDFGVNIPEWKDFAPAAYVDVKEPKGLSKLNVNSQYWFQRRVEFEEALDNCQDLPDSEERFSCYEALKVKQYKLNDDYNARVEAIMNNSATVPGMENRTDSMFPIGGYLDAMTKFMPNEVR